jgi:uroporphyrinogen-III decarboxylase
MNGKQREALTMRHVEPDRVPVHCQLSIGHYNLNGGFKPHQIWYETEAFVEATVKLARRYRFDGVLVVLPGRPPDYLDKNLNSIRETESGEWLTWRNGDRTFFPWDDMPQHYPSDPNKPVRADFATFDPQAEIQRIDQYLGYTWNVHVHMQDIPGKSDPGLLVDENLPDYFFGAFDQVKAQVRDELSVHGSVYSPLTHYMELFGYENALVSFLTDPGKAHAILDLLCQSAITWAVALVRHGADAIDLSSAFVGAPFFSRKLYREFVIPYERRVNEAVKARGGIVYTHTCGQIGDRLDLMLETGTLGIDTLDPPPLADGNLAKAKREFGDKLFFKGNLNSVALLDYKTPEEVIAAATDCLNVGMPQAGYILGTACSVAPHVEPWKLELLVPLAEEKGRYA